MTYTKKFQGNTNTTGQLSPISGNNSNHNSWNNRNQHENNITPDQFGYKNYGNRLPEVYIGHPNRIDRYNQYEMMDIDAEINACLDIIAEFCTQKNEQNKTPFNIEFSEEPTPHEVELLKKQLQQWCKLNEFDTRVFKIFRNTLKYGDQVFVRDPENFKLYWVDMTKVTKVIVNESEGKKPEQYVIKDLNINLENLTVAQKVNTDFAVNPATGSGGVGGGMAGGGYTAPMNSASGGRFTMGISESAVDAKHVVHLSLTEGLDRFWPFGQSILEMIFKVFKQKELLEDAVLIYRVQRAPERRVFKIDVGNMPSHMAMAFVERVKNEIHQRRIPSAQGGSGLDATYNPMSMLEDYYFPVSEGGRGSSVEVLPGGCLSMDTKVPLLDGREVTLADLTTEFNSGKENWTYSCDPKTGRVVPGIISWAGVTQKSAKVLKITLDNGESIIVTPDHKFPVYDQEFKRADEFKVGDSMIPLYRKKEALYDDSDYELYFDNEEKEWKYTHRMVADYLKDTVVKYFVFNESKNNGEYQVRHHKDFNRFNNDPNNLCWMSKGDHYEYHSKNSGLKFNTMRENNPEEYKRLQEKISLGLRKYWKNLTPDERANKTNAWNNLTPEEYEVRVQRQSDSLTKFIAGLSREEKQKRDEKGRNSLKEASKAFNEMMNTDPEFRKMVLDKRIAYWTDENRKIRGELVTKSNYKNWSGKKGKARSEKMSADQSVTYTHEMLREVIDLVRGKTIFQVTASDVNDSLNKNDQLRSQLKELNKNKIVRNWTSERGFTETGVRNMVVGFGYKNWKDFRKKESVYNHRIIAIEALEEPIEVGTLTIDAGEKYHNHHTFALSCGVFTKNSNLSEIDDLRWFNNKMARGLRVPSSYLPTGPDDQQSVLNDGKVGTAMIQEFRFNQYCERLQKYVSQKFDEEFKLFLRWRGLNVDSGLFTLNFNPPQNFASYRQSEMDTARVNTYTTMEAFPYISKRFAMERFLGLTKEEIVENEKMWHEENTEPEDQNASGSDLRNVGISTGDIQSDTDTAEEMESPPEEDLGMGPEVITPVNPPIAGAAGSAESASGM